MLHQQGVEGHGELVESELARFSLCAFRAVNIHRCELRGRSLVGGGEFLRRHIAGSRSKGGIEFFSHIPRCLVCEIDRATSGESSASIVEDQKPEAIWQSGPIDCQRCGARWDVECQIAPRGIENPAGDHPHVCGIQKEVAVVADSIVVRGRANLRRRECGSVSVEKQKCDGATRLRGSANDEGQPDCGRHAENQSPRECHSSRDAHARSKKIACLLERARIFIGVLVWSVRCCVHGTKIEAL